MNFRGNILYHIYVYVYVVYYGVGSKLIWISVEKSVILDYLLCKEVCYK